MRCKKHLTTDLTSSIGVCATCLRDHLSSLLAAQSHANALSDPRHRDSDPHIFPPSVSPNYNSRRKPQAFTDPRFCTTSHYQPSRDCGDMMKMKKKKQSRLSLFASLFKPKSDKEANLDVPIPKSRDTIASTSSSCSSPFWFSTKKQSRLFSVEEPIDHCDFKTTVRLRRDRGMYPAGISDVEDDDDVSNELSQKIPESSKQTPSRASKRGGGQSCHSTNVSGFSFCLSPLVRASPGRARNQKGVLPEVSFSGDTRNCAKPPLSMATKYCANRSRKIADFGRFNHNH